MYLKYGQRQSSSDRPRKIIRELIKRVHFKLKNEKQKIALYSKLSNLLTSKKEAPGRKLGAK
jgi:hypothetical protein